MARTTASRPNWAATRVYPKKSYLNRLITIVIMQSFPVTRPLPGFRLLDQAPQADKEAIGFLTLIDVYCSMYGPMFFGVTSSVPVLISIGWIPLARSSHAYVTL